MQFKKWQRHIKIQKIQHNKIKFKKYSLDTIKTQLDYKTQTV